MSGFGDVNFVQTIYTNCIFTVGKSQWISEGGRSCSSSSWSDLQGLNFFTFKTHLELSVNLSKTCLGFTLYTKIKRKTVNYILDFVLILNDDPQCNTVNNLHHHGWINK